MSPHLFILLLLAFDINPNPGPPKCLKVTHENIRSIHNKYPIIAEFISNNGTDLYAMLETWICPYTTSANLCEITPPGYNLYFFCQKWIGSFRCSYKDLHHPSRISSSKYPYKEFFHFLNIYRPPSSSTPIFFEQFQSLLEDIHHMIKNLVIIGDFNFYLETTCSNSKI